MRTAAQLAGATAAARAGGGRAVIAPWLGAVLTMAATGGFGLLLARQLRRRPQDLAALQAALSCLRTEVEYGRTPLPEALVRAAAGPPAVRGLFSGAAARLQAERGATAAEAWTEALAEAELRSAWSPEDTALIRWLGEQLGRSDTSDQVRHIEGCLRRLRAAEAEARRGLERRVRMWLYLGVLAGAGLVLAAR